MSGKSLAVVLRHDALSCCVLLFVSLCVIVRVIVVAAACSGSKIVASLLLGVIVNEGAHSCGCKYENGCIKQHRHERRVPISITSPKQVVGHYKVKQAYKVGNAPYPCGVVGMLEGVWHAFDSFDVDVVLRWYLIICRFHKPLQTDKFSRHVRAEHVRARPEVRKAVCHSTL